MRDIDMLKALTATMADDMAGDIVDLFELYEILVYAAIPKLTMTYR